MLLAGVAVLVILATLGIALIAKHHRKSCKGDQWNGPIHFAGDY